MPVDWPKWLTLRSVFWVTVRSAPEAERLAQSLTFIVAFRLPRRLTLRNILRLNLTLTLRLG